jgi:hypothetical protein
MTFEEATALYLRILRDTGHGCTGQNDKDRRRDEVLLVSHTGDIPEAFALLPCVYWLDTVSEPVDLRRRPTTKSSGAAVDLGMPGFPGIAARTLTASANRLER